MNSPEQLKFPIGKFKKPEVITKSHIDKWTGDISKFPERLNKEVKLLSDAQLDTTYREGGWTLRQVIHHCADSHINSLIRFKLALTEEKPTIKPYFEDRWAQLSDYKMPIEPSLKLLEGLHKRWVFLLNKLNEGDLKKAFVHPEHQQEFLLDETIGIYAWHCNHHLAHITTLKQLKGWA